MSSPISDHILTTESHKILNVIKLLTLTISSKWSTLCKALNVNLFSFDSLPISDHTSQDEWIRSYPVLISKALTFKFSSQ